jgi:hypothetical protein
LRWRDCAIDFEQRIEHAAPFDGAAALVFRWKARAAS